MHFIEEDQEEKFYSGHKEIQELLQMIPVLDIVHFVEFFYE